MQKLSDEQRKSLAEATSQYHESLPGSPAEGYLESRGLFPSNPKVAKFRLGFVADPQPGHEMYRGCLAIPYLRRSPGRGWTVVSLRFRRLVGDGPKYMTQAGDRPRLYNTLALLQRSADVCVTEGEIDAITAQLCGLNTVGVPGAQAWLPHFREPFLGYRTVYVLADGDDAGMLFANTVAGTLPNAKVIPMPSGQDVNSIVVDQGPQQLLERIKRK